MKNKWLGTGKREDIFPQKINSMGLRIGVEVGVQQGLFSQHLLENSTLDHLFCIDMWEEPTRREARKKKEKCVEIYMFAVKNLMPFKNCCNLIKLDSVRGAALFKNDYFDFIFIDAGHTYEDVKRDIKVWYPKLREGGVMAFHDYHRRRSGMGVIEATDEFAKEHKYKLKKTTEKCTPSVWFIKGEHNEQI
jgi:hypothetical protein